MCAATGGMLLVADLRGHVYTFVCRGREVHGCGKSCHVVPLCSARASATSKAARGGAHSRGHISWTPRPKRKPRQRGLVSAAALSPQLLQSAREVAVVVMRSAQELMSNPKIRATILSSLVSVSMAAASSRAIGLGLEADIAGAVARSAIQLSALSLALRYMFAGEQMVQAVLFIVVMVFAAGHIVGERASKLPHSHLVGVVSLFLGSLVPVGLMVALRVFPSSPAFLVPATAHVLGAAVIMVGMTLEALHHEVFSRERQIEAALALGATPEQAIKSPVRRALNLGMAPQIDALKTMGLVSTPGIMTGMIMGGTAPLDAVQQQIQMLNVVVGASALSCIFASIIGGRMLFSTTCQLLPLRG